MSLRSQVNAFSARAAAHRRAGMADCITLVSGATTLQLAAALSAARFNRILTETGWVNLRNRVARLDAGQPGAQSLAGLNAAAPSGLVGAALTDPAGQVWRVTRATAPNVNAAEWLLDLSAPAVASQ